MCDVIDISSKIVNENKICWKIRIEQSEGYERIGINRNRQKIFIYITTYSFDRLLALKEQALKQAKDELSKGIMEYVE